MADDTVLLEVRDGVAHLTLNRPEAANGIDADLARDLLTAVSAITLDDRARVVLLSGKGPRFCGGGDVKTAEKIARIPVWCFHGDKDGAVKVDRSRDMIAALKKAGGEPKYTEYKGVGHDSWTATYRDPKFHEWLFAQKKGS